MACYLSVEEMRNRREKVLELLGRLYRSGSGRLERVHASWSREQGFPPEAIRSHISDMNRRFKENGLDYLRVASNRQYGNTRYGLRVDKRVIKIAEKVVGGESMAIHAFGYLDLPYLRKPGHRGRRADNS